MQDGSESACAEVIEAGRFGVQYEPIVEIATRAPCAWEALARFFARDGRVLPNEEVFGWLHRSPRLLVQTEFALKQLQVERAPREPLFVNIDPDSHALAEEHRTPLLPCLSSHPKRVVVEVIENVSTSDAGRIRRMIRDVRTAGLGVALDDLGAPNALVSLESLVQVDLLKFDRSILASIRDLRHRALVEGLVSVARRVGVRTVLEGVETEADLVAAEGLGVDLAQGYLFRSAFVRVEATARAVTGARLGSAAPRPL